jgi:hypothetical protein
MIRVRHLLCAAALLAGCAPPPPAPAAETPQPRESIQETYGAKCEWGEVTAAGISIWSYACPNDRLVADEALPGFQRETRDASGQVMRGLAVRFFTRAPDAPIESVLGAVRAASPGAETCEITAGSHGDYVLMPTGDAAAAYQRYVEGKGGDGEPVIPCGSLGPTEAGGTTFRLIDGAPNKVAMIAWPSDVPIFDPDTLRVTGDADRR